MKVLNVMNEGWLIKLVFSAKPIDKMAKKWYFSLNSNIEIAI